MVLLRLEGDASGIVNPGQFVNIRVPEKFLRRPISVCDWDGERLIVIYKVVGKGTGQMSGMKPGEALERRIEAMREAALGAIRPARTWRRLDDLAELDMRGSKSLAAHLGKCHAAYLACGTIGATFDALQRSTAATSAADALPAFQL